MNLFTAERVAYEAGTNGKHVLIVTSDNVATTGAFERCSRVSGGVRRQSRRNGAECIEFVGGGRIDFRSVRGNGERGMAADYVVVDDEATRRVIMDDLDKLKSLQAVVQARRGEIIDV